MRKLKVYFAKWDISRWLRFVLGIIFMMAYAAEGQALYLGVSVFLLVQAVMNIGCGCATNNCSTSTNSDKTAQFEIKNLETKNNDV